MTQMGQQGPPLPPGFVAQFDQRYNRYFYVNTATGRSQWEFPQMGPNAGTPSQSMYGSPPPYNQQQPYGQGPPPQQQWQQGPPPQQQWQQGPPPPQGYYQQQQQQPMYGGGYQQPYYQQGPPPPAQHQPQYSQQPQTVVVQEKQKKQGFMSSHPMLTGLAAGAVGAYAVHEIGEHFEEEREEAYMDGRQDGFESGYADGLEDGGDFDF
ncbi:hypothetical protein FB645_005909 [Coemansia sp. IMI 203386]|nr:hypothetical protein FB645_005909 [Coemansia sp. IMI 203386]